MTTFKKVGLFVKYDDRKISGSLINVYNYLKSKNIEVVIEDKSAELVDINEKTVAKEQLASLVDLIIVIGGDGSLLNLSNAMIDSNTPILGINRGRLGFLVDIHPDEFETYLDQILAGKYTKEKRFLIGASIAGKQISSALNDIVLYNSDTSRMIDFEVYVNDKFMMKQRADGLITATPTGSTAYALSGGGPILTPGVDSILLLPMFSHILSSRPIVLSRDDEVDIIVLDNNRCTLKISCDGQVHLPVKVGEKISIKVIEKEINIIHPDNYNYFDVLRKKLNWIP